MTPQKAEMLLGLRRPYSTEDVDSSFKAAVKRLHPDTRDAAETYGVEMTSLKMARDLLRRLTVTGDNRKCDECQGRGLVPAKHSFHQLPCQSCQGKGRK